MKRSTNIVRRLLQRDPELLAQLSMRHAGAAPTEALDLRAALTRGLQRAEQIRSRADARLDDLLDAPPEKRLFLFTNMPPETRSMLVHLVAERAFELRFTDRELGQQYIAVAVDLLPHLPPTTSTSYFSADTEFRVYLYRANYHRIGSRIQESLDDFARAKRALRRGSAAGLDRALYNELRAILDIDQGAYAEALAKLVFTVRQYKEDGHKRLPDAILSRGHAQLELERFGQALADFRTALKSTDDDLLILIASHSIAVTLERAGKARAALRHLHQIHGLYEDPAVGPAFPAVRSWVYGRVHLQLGWYDEAIANLETARTAFLQQKLPFKAAWAGLDLAEALCHVGSYDRAIDLALILHVQAVEQRLPTDALIAFLAVKEAAAEAVLTTNLIRNASLHIRRIRLRPGARFEPL